MSRFIHKPRACVSFFTRCAMTQLKDYAHGAGLLPVVGTRVHLSNEMLPVVRSDESAVVQDEPLFCKSPEAAPTQATFLYFTLPGCENCRPGLSEFARLGRSIPSDKKATLCMRIVVSDWPTLPEIQAELRSSPDLREWGVVWDSKGLLTERLAVLGQPALYLLDGRGQVSAYRNGPVSFVSPGFESFWHVLLQALESRYLLSESEVAQRALIEEPIQIKSSDYVSFLNNSLLPAVWLVSLILLCYSLTRFVLQLRKNFRGSQNKS